MANAGDWTNSHQQDMSEFDNGDTFSTGDGFNIGELSGLDGMHDNISLCIYCIEKRLCKVDHLCCSSARSV
jgi:hypothetical protein